MAHLFVRRHHVHLNFVALLLMAALVLVLTFAVRGHKPPPAPSWDRTTPMPAHGAP